jgi:hypothetical protein
MHQSWGFLLQVLVATFSVPQSHAYFITGTNHFSKLAMLKFIIHAIFTAKVMPKRAVVEWSTMAIPVIGVAVVVGWKYTYWIELLGYLIMSVLSLHRIVGSE